MITWCGKNKIKINSDKTHVLFNEYHAKDSISVKGMRIGTTKSIRYLGAQLTANSEEKQSTFLVDTSGIAKQIIQRCNVIKRLRKYEIPEIFRQAFLAFIGGIFNFYLPWLGAELNIKQTSKPLQLAYHQYMRAVTGCISSTPIPLL